MQFSTVNFAIRKSNQRNALKLAPAAPAEPNLEAFPLANGEIRGNRLNFPNLTEDKEIHPH